MKILGITGGIGSGKSTVARIIYDLGARIINADRIARRVVRRGALSLEEIKKEFGEGILTEKGSLDRKKIGSIVFKVPEKRRKLEEITHKYIIAEIYRKVARLKSEEAELAVLDVPIPVKNGFLDIVDEVWVVVADRKKRIDRIVKRNGLSYDEVINRLESQMSDEEYMKIADRVIENNGTVEELEKKVAKLFVRQKTG